MHLTLIPLSLCATVFIAISDANAQAQAVRPEAVATGLQNPWALAFLPQGRFLVTERPGRLRVVEPDGRLGPPVAGLPAINAGGQGGLLDVITDAGFAANRRIYFCFSEPAVSGGGNSTALARATLAADNSRLEEVQVLFSQKPKFSSSAHFGCRIVEAHKDGKPDGTLFLTLGDRYSRMQDAQKLDNHHGKVVRINKDGSVPKDNPFVGRAGALPEIWSYGHRNMQGATLAPDGSYWTHEHGPQGGDEINLPQPGRNYGWPVITYGENYGGGKMGEGITARAGMEQPLHYWVPSIAPSGMVFLTSTRYGPAWQGNLFVGSLKFGYLNRIELSAPFKGQVVREHKLLDGGGERIRDVRQGPDGLLYVLTDSPRGRLLRLQPG
jgi:glucose/arabinose dehydrogenase